MQFLHQMFNLSALLLLDDALLKYVVTEVVLFWKYRNDLYCVGWGVTLNSTHSLIFPNQFASVAAIELRNCEIGNSFFITVFCLYVHVSKLWLHSMYFVLWW